MHGHRILCNSEVHGGYQTICEVASTSLEGSGLSTPNTTNTFKHPSSLVFSRQNLELDIRYLGSSREVYEFTQNFIALVVPRVQNMRRAREYVDELEEKIADAETEARDMVETRHREQDQVMILAAISCPGILSSGTLWHTYFAKHGWRKRGWYLLVGHGVVEHLLFSHSVDN